MKKHISVVIPAKNEERLITSTIQAIGNQAGIKEIIVVDDGSTDKTAYYAKAANAYVWSNKRNLGKGAALNMGASLAKGSIILFLDADLGRSAKEAVRLCQPIITQKADCVIAKFPEAIKKGGFGLVKGLARWGVENWGGQMISAALSGQRALNRFALEAIFPIANGFGAEVDMTIRLLRKGFRIQEMEAAMEHRETGRSWAGFCHRGKQFQHILITLAKEGWK